MGLHLKGKKDKIDLSQGGGTGRRAGLKNL